MAAPFRVKALFEYSSPHEDDLNFGIGQIITVTDEEDADWYSGEYTDDAGVKQEGIFPRNFVEKFEPQAPPRPTRTRTKREPPAAQHAEKTEAPPPPPPAQEEATPDLGPEPEIEEADEPVQKPTHTERQAPAASEPAPRKSLDSVPAHAPVPAIPKASEPVVTAPAPAPGPSQAPKPKGPPPVSEKPKSSSFKDRIAAFNKPAAPPVAPFKPSGLGGSGSGFIKKPFVAPPPSRHAFIPPPQQAPTAKIYRRDEDPEIKEREAEVQGQAEKAGLVPTESQEGDEEDQPKPTSLKERIALLQKQQMEQAQRHADAAAKKEKPEKPKKPVKKRESMSHAEGAGEAEELSPPALERRDTQESGPRTSVDEPRPARMPPPPRRKSSKGPPIESIHDGNEADMSGAGDTTEGNDDLTEREDSDGLSRRPSKAPTLPIQPGVAPELPKRAESDDEEEVEEEGEEEEEDVDPEVRRKEELRARMAKMSGGMGFLGMFGAPPVPGPPAPAKKKKAPKVEQSPVDEDEEPRSPAARAAPPIPTMMALPGMGAPRKSEESTRPDEQPEPATRGPPPPLPTRQIDEEAEEESEEEGEITPAPTAPPTSLSPHASIRVPHTDASPVPPRDVPPPPVPGGRPAPPPVPSEGKPMPLVKSRFIH